MRTMLLSFKADVYERVISGEKIYEHRKVFPNEPIKAYLYISSPVKAIAGIMYLSNRTELKDWKEKYSNDKNALLRIDSYMKHHKYAMEITSFQNTDKISLETLRNDIPGFVVPQMYYFIDNTTLLDYLEKHLHSIGKLITHSFNDISSGQICLH